MPRNCILPQGTQSFLRNPKIWFPFSQNKQGSSSEEAYEERERESGSQFCLCLTVIGSVCDCVLTLPKSTQGLQKTPKYRKVLTTCSPVTQSGSRHSLTYPYESSAAHASLWRSFQPSFLFPLQFDHALSKHAYIFKIGLYPKSFFLTFQSCCVFSKFAWVKLFGRRLFGLSVAHMYFVLVTSAKHGMYVESRGFHWQQNLFGIRWNNLLKSFLRSFISGESTKSQIKQF